MKNGVLALLVVGANGLVLFAAWNFGVSLWQRLRRGVPLQRAAADTVLARPSRFDA